MHGLDFPIWFDALGLKFQHLAGVEKNTGTGLTNGISDVMLILGQFLNCRWNSHACTTLLCFHLPDRYRINTMAVPQTQPTGME